MTLQYQPSAAGISWLTMCDNLSNRMQMEQELLDISATTTGIQAELTTVSSNQTLAELNDAATGQAQQANMQIAGAVLGIATSVGTYFTGLGLSKNSTNTSEKTIGLEQQNKELGDVELSTLKSNGETISATVDAEPTSTSDAPGANKATETASQKQSMNPHAKMLISNGTTIGQMIQSGINAGGQSLEAQATAKQAQDKALEVEAQGIASVMNSQQQMTAANINSCDTNYNNAASNLTALIQASAVRG